MTTVQFNSIIDTGALAQLSAAAGSPPDPESADFIREKHAIKEFEAVFATFLLKQLRQTTGEDGLFAGDKTDSYGGLFDLHLGRELANANFLPLGAQLAPYLEAAALAKQGPETPANREK